MQDAPACNDTALQHGIWHCKAEAAHHHSSKKVSAANTKIQGTPEAIEVKSAGLLLQAAACLQWRQGCYGQRIIAKPQAK